jgi:hypothetical protein
LFAAPIPCGGCNPASAEVMVTASLALAHSSRTFGEVKQKIAERNAFSVASSDYQRKAGNRHERIGQSLAIENSGPCAFF